MSSKNYRFDNREAQVKSTNNKLNIKQSSNLVFNQEKAKVDNNKSYHPTTSNLNKINANNFAKEKINNCFINSLEETYNCSSFSPINKKPTQNTNEIKPNNSNVNEKQGLKLSNLRGLEDIQNKITTINSSKGEDINFNMNEGKNDFLSNQIKDTLPSNNRLPRANYLITNKIKPKNNNLSLNLINKNTFFKNLSLNNNITKTTTNKNSSIKSQFSMNPSNPTILKSSFIMAGLEKKTKMDSDDQDIELKKILNQDNEEKSKLVDNLNNNLVKSKNDIYGISKNKKAKGSIGNYDDYNNNNNKTLKINSRPKSKNNSIYNLTNSQNECLSKVAKNNKNRSISFNNFKYNSFASNNYNSGLKRNNSQNFKGIISNKAVPILSSYGYSSQEKKNSLDLLNSKYMKMLNESKTQSITDINKKYNEVYKYKKLPTSLTMKNLKTITDKRPVNGTISRCQDKANFEENLIKSILNTNGNKNKIIKPIAKNNSYVYKDLNSFSNLNEINISDLHNPNVNEKNNFVKNEESKKNNADICNEIKMDFDNHSKEKYANKPELNNALKNYNIGDLYKSRSKNKYVRNSISKENWSSKDFQGNNAFLNLKNEIKKPLKNYEVKSKFRNRIFNDKKFKDLYNPKIKNQAKTHNNINNEGNEGVSSDIESMKKLGDNLMYLVELEDKLNKRFKIKNKSLAASSNLNWNNLFVNGKSHNNFLTKNNKIQRNKSDNKTQIGYIDGLINKRQNDFNSKQSNFNSIGNNKDHKNFEKKLSLNSNENKTANVNQFKNTAKDQMEKIKEDIEANKNNQSLMRRDFVNLGISSTRIKDNATISTLNKHEEVKKPSNPNQRQEFIGCLEKQLKQLKLKLDKKTIEDNSITNSIILKTANERILSDRNNNIKSLCDAKNILESVHSNIKVFENVSDIQLKDISNYYNLDTDKELIFNNINATESDVVCEEIKFESDLSKDNSNNKTRSNFSKQQISNNNRISYSNFIKNLNNNELQDQQENENLISNLVLHSKDSLNKNFQINTDDDSECSKYADYVEDMNTLIKKLDFASVNKNVESVFSIRSKFYHEFNVKFKSEIEGHLFPQKNQINSVRKRNDSNSKSVSTQDTSSKKTISPHNYKSLKGIIMESGREKINLYNVHLSKI